MEKKFIPKPKIQLSELLRKGKSEQEITQELKNKEKVYAEFYEILEGIQVLLETKKPKEWFSAVYFRLNHLLKEKKYTPEVKEFISQHLKDLIALVRPDEDRQKGEEFTEEEITVEAQEIIHHIGTHFEKEEKEKEFKMRGMSIEEVVKKSQGRIELENKGEYRYLVIQLDKKSPRYEFPLPASEEVYHKGGFPRVVLKILAGAPREMIEAELPPNDFDMVAFGKKEDVQEEAKRLNVDMEGIEMSEGTATDKNLFKLLTQRDVTLNGVFLGKDRMVFLEDALKSNKTGHIDVMKEERGIYGRNVIKYEGVDLMKGRAISRVLKFVIEGKAKSFDFMPLNAKADFGIHWLVLVRKLAKKEEKRGENLEKLWYLAKKMQLVPPGAKDIYEVIESVHQQYPWVDLEAGPQDPVGLTKWFYAKLAKYIDKRFREQFGIASDLGLEREMGDTISKEISLEAFKPDKEKEKELSNGWEDFTQHCRQRYIEYKEGVLKKQPEHPSLAA